MNTLQTNNNSSPGRMVEHPKSMSAKPSPRPDGTPCMYLGPLTQIIRLVSGGSFLLSGDYQIICRIELPGTGYGTTRRSRVPKYAMNSARGKENLWGTTGFYGFESERSTLRTPQDVLIFEICASHYISGVVSHLLSLWLCYFNCFIFYWSLTCHRTY